ncbi:MAG: type III-B CRISPR module-associated protein Cmr5 [Candidatus Thorarchaeota archaeon]|nr:MAG: type III-B CRISPR module-associated protein Cmr5 [Candidatus Thorarchaeota archaeon]
MKQSLQQTLDQKRAERAWDDVSTVKQQDFRDKYGSLVKRLPMYVLTNGLGQTLAFLRAKGAVEPGKQPSTEKKAHKAAYEHLSYWVTEQIYGTRDDKLLERIIRGDSQTYRRATAEALAYLTWLKRFAEAELPTEEG